MLVTLHPMTLAVAGSLAVLLSARASASVCTLEFPTELLAPAPSAFAQFGYAVALDGDTLLAGEPTKRVGVYDDVGAAQVFRWNGCWLLEQSLMDTSAEEYDRFGQALALQGDRALVGIPGDRPGSPTSARSGSVDYWEREGISWTKLWQFVPSDPSEDQRFGHAVALDGSLVVVGAPRDDEGGENAGAVYVFRWREGAWTEEAKLVAPNAQPGDQFGWSVAARGGTIVASTPYADVDGAANLGSTVVYRLLEGGWSLDQQLACDGCTAGSEFGWSVALQEDVLVVGSPRGADPGAAYVFRQNEQGYALEQELVAGFAQIEDEHFGESVAVHGSAIAVGDSTAPDPEFGFPVGAVQTFHFNGTVWRDDGTVYGDLVGNAVYFGFSCALDERRLVVGAPLYNTIGIPGDAGQVTVFDVAGGDWSGTSTISLPTIGSGELLGSAVAISQDTMLVGAPEAEFGGVVEVVDVDNGVAQSQWSLARPCSP